MSPLLGELITATLVAVRAGDDDVIRPIAATARDRDHMIYMIDVANRLGAPPAQPGLERVLPPLVGHRMRLRRPVQERTAISRVGAHNLGVATLIVSRDLAHPFAISPMPRPGAIGVSQAIFPIALAYLFAVPFSVIGIVAQALCRFLCSPTPTSLNIAFAVGFVPLRFASPFPASRG